MPYMMIFQKFTAGYERWSVERVSYPAGKKQRLAIARAVINAPELLIW
ncbi:hypothetical protein AAULR_12897, partial [Lacticaseibacillus rhamnosus MTCC 5462]